jgi:hypothetical protein
MSQQRNPERKKLIVLSVLLGTTTLLAVTFLLYAVSQKAEADRMAQNAENSQVISRLQAQEAEKQRQLAAEQEEILKLRIFELEYKYEMCLSKK